MKFVTTLVFLALTTPAALAQDAPAGPDLAGAAAFMKEKIGDSCFSRNSPDFPDDMKTDVVYTITYKPDYAAAEDPDQTYYLYKMFCDAGAYNVVDMYLTHDYDGNFTVLSFPEPKAVYDYTDDTESALKSDPKIIGYTASNTLINSDYDEASKTIVSFEKWRGIGDAYSNGTWSFRSGEFLLTKYVVDPLYAKIEDENAEIQDDGVTFTLFDAGS